MKKFNIFMAISLLFTVACFQSCKKEIPKEVSKPSDVGTVYTDKIYKSVNNTDQKLDIYMPTNGATENIPVVVYFHGGMWAVNTKDKINHGFLAEVTNKLRDEGYAVVSCDFRQLTANIEFPINIEDCKDAIRYVRKQAPFYKFDANNIGAWGSSSGGHLALMTGLANDTLYSVEPTYAGVSAQVNYVLDFFAPTDLPAYFVLQNQSEFNLLSTTDPSTYTEEVTNVLNFFGVDPSTSDSNFFTAQEMTIQNSPITHVDTNDPAILIMHGTADNIVPLKQSNTLETKLKAANVPYEYYKFDGATHSFTVISDSQLTDVVNRTVAFVKKYTK